MASQFNVFSLPVHFSEEAQTQLNRFLHSHQVLNTTWQFINDGPNSFWTVLIEYFDGEKAASVDGRNRSRVDYREKLSADDFNIFVKLREWRKVTAEKEGVPVYTIFSNDQLAKIAVGRLTDKETLRKIDGIGAARIDKYGNAVTGLIKQNVVFTEENK